MKTTKTIQHKELSVLLAILKKKKLHTAQQLFETLSTRYAVKRNASSKLVHKKQKNKLNKECVWQN